MIDMQQPWLQCFTTRITDEGGQLLNIRPHESESPDDMLFLDEQHSELLTEILDEVTKDHSLPWSGTRQAVLRAFVKVLGPAR
jgi:hypothetical protein